MGDFALITYELEASAPRTKRKAILTYFKTVKELLTGGYKKIQPRHIPLYDGTLNLILFELPYTYYKLQRLSAKRQKKLESKILEISSKEKILHAYCPTSILKLGIFNNNIVRCCNGQHLYKALIVSILDEIFTSRGVKLSSLDVAIISGENYDELYSLIWFISPHIKYLTIVTEDKDIIMNELEKLCNDTGLSVRTTNDLKNGLCESDVIINLLSAYNFNHSLRIKSKAIVINYNNSDIKRVLDKNELINSLEIEIPVKIRGSIPEEVFRLFSPLEVSEILAAHKAEKNECLASDKYEQSILSCLAREFFLSGFSIKGFTGRHGLLKKEDIIITSTSSGKAI